MAVIIQINERQEQNNAEIKQELSAQNNKIEQALSAQNKEIRQELSAQNQELSAQNDEIKQSLAKQCASQEEIRQELSAQIRQELSAQNDEIKRSLAKQCASQEEMKQELLAQNDEIKQSLAKQCASQEEMKLELATQNNKIEQIEQRTSENLRKVDEKIHRFKHEILAECVTSEKVDVEINHLRQEILELKKSGTTNSQASSIKLKPPTFDGTSPFEVFQLQFETATTKNHWSEDDKVAALIVALKGGAAEILQMIPENDRGNYKEIMRMLDRRYGHDHRREMYRLELKGKFQKVGETLQEFASDIERMVYKAHTNTPAESIERIKIDTFTDGIRDPEIRKAVLLAPKATFAETIACALTNETVQAMVKPAIKMRRIETSNEQDGVNNRPTIRRWDGSGRITCWVCMKPGHISRDCWERKNKRPRSPSPIRRRPREENGLAAEESQNNTNPLN